MNTFSFSQVEDPTSYYPTVKGTQFVCEACPCGELEMFALGNGIICECPHIVQVLYNGECQEVHSLGVRQ